VVEARDAAGRYRDLLDPVVQVQASGGNQIEVGARQVAPGRYEGAVIAAADQMLTVSVTVSGTAAETATASPRPTRHLVPDLDAEYRFRPADQALLQAIADATGGKMRPRAVDLTEQGRADQTTRRALWPALVIGALALWMLDILLRRIRMFEPA
jgi:Ca-activated chloride channel family protein